MINKIIETSEQLKNALKPLGCWAIFEKFVYWYLNTISGLPSAGDLLGWTIKKQNKSVYIPMSCTINELIRRINHGQ